jgi:two-component system LytT family sensor kinase
LIGYLFAFFFFWSTDPLELYLTPPVSGSGFLIHRLSTILLEAAINNTLIIVVQNSVILRHAKANADLENARLSAANLESANLLLKQQIHPHFLFNALSMLKSLYKTDLKAGEEYLSHLVDSPSGKGLINLMERYKILSSEDVIIRQDAGSFSVSIKVLSNENNDH